MAPNPFDLNRALLDWRSRRASESPWRDEDLDEMESHLRDSVAALEALGLPSDEAFLLATRRLGPSDELAAELARVHPAETFRIRAIWMLVGMLLLGWVGDLARVASDLTILAGVRLSAGPQWVAWAGALAHAAVLGLAAIAFVRFARGRWSGPGAPGSARPRPLRFLAPALLATLLISKGLAHLGLGVLVRELDTTTLGGVFALRGWGSALDAFLLVVVTTLFLVALLRRGSGPSRTIPALLLAAAAACLLPAFQPRLQAAPPERAPGSTVIALAAATPATTPTPASTGFDETLRLWKAGTKDEALAHFARVDFSRRPLFPKGSLLGYSEREFVALPRAVNEKLQPQILEEVRPLKGLALHVRDAANAAASRGDKTRADLYLGQLKACGTALEGPDSLALVQMVGKAISKMAANPGLGTPAPKSR